MKKVSLKKFKQNIEELFGQKLTQPALEAVEDFWNNWSSFNELIADDLLEIHVDPLRLAHNFPKYKRYQTFKGLGIAVIIIGIICTFFVWKIALGIIVVGLIINYWGMHIRFSDAKDFAEELMLEATLNPNGGGYAMLCANYITGIIKIASPEGSAHWPQYPSNIITGNKSFIST